MKNITFLIVGSFGLLFTAACSQTDEPAKREVGRDDFVGTWRLTEVNSRTGKHTYDLVIAAGSGSNEIVITDPRGEFKGTVSGSSFTITKAPVEGAMYSASGSLDGDQLAYNSTLTGRSVERHSSGVLLSDGSDITCTGTGTRVDTSTVDPARENYIATWEIVNEGQSSSKAWEVTIKAGSGGNEIILKNLTNVEAPVDRGRKGISIGRPTREEILGTIENNNITIPKQSHDDTQYSGSGTLDGDAISLKLTKNEYGPKQWTLVGKRQGATLPTVATRDDYLGSWGHPTKVYMDIKITAGSKDNEIVIENFWRPRYSGVTVTATVDGSKFTVPEQELDDHMISGSGTISGVASHDTMTYDCATLWVSGKREARGGGTFTGYKK